MSDTLPRLLIATTVASTLSAFLLPYAEHFRSLGWRVDAVASDLSNSNLAHHFDHCWDIPWSRSPLDPSNLLDAAPKITKLVQENEYDIVHVHTPVAAFVTRYALRNRKSWKKNTRVVYTAHGFHFFKGGKKLTNFLYQTLEKIAGKWTDTLIVINQEDYEAAQRLKIVPQSSLVYMPGIGLDFTAYGRESVSEEAIQNLRQELGLVEEDVLFSMVAEFIPRKRHSDLLEAVAQCQNPRIHVALAGNGSLFEDSKQLAKTLGISQQIHFLGHRRDIPVIMRASVATILTSGQEGLARCVMESACQGIPVIGADARGIRDIINQERGILYPIGNISALQRSLQNFLGKTHARIEPDPNWDILNLICLHQDLYAKLLPSGELERQLG